MKAEDRAWRPYPAYRDSGIEWLGKVPGHWHVRRMRHLATLNPPRSRIPELDPHAQVSFIPMEAVRQWGGLDLTATKCVAEVGYGYTYFQDGDILVAKITPCFENGKGARAQALSNGVGFGTTELHVLRPRREVDSWFLFYVTISQPFRTMGAAAMYGAAGQQRVPDSFVRNFFVALPPLPEQRAIAAFLDRETARIDALVEKKQRLIELLREKRQAVITRAVTRGLDPSVRMKESGIEWLGKVPEHWEVVPSTWLFTESNHRALEGDEQLSATQKYGVIPQAEFERLEGRQVVHAFLHLDQRKHVGVDDFVISMRSFEGGLERVRASGCVRSSYVVLRPSNEAHVGFFAYLFKSSAYIQALRSTSNFIRDGQDLNYGNFRLVKLPRVPWNEQDAIATFLDHETERIDELIAKLEQHMTLLREHRQALVTAAVTGQIDVREG